MGDWKQQVERDIAFFTYYGEKYLTAEDAAPIAWRIKALLDVAVAADDALRDDNGFANLACILDKLREVSDE